VKKTPLATLLIFCLAGAAHAGMTVAQFKQGASAKRDSSIGIMFSSFLGGVAQGVGYSEVLSQQSGGRRLYCPPGSFVLDADAVKHYVTQELSALNALKTGKFDEQEVALLLIVRLRDTYPCKQ